MPAAALYSSSSMSIYDAEIALAPINQSPTACTQAPLAAASKRVACDRRLHATRIASCNRLHMHACMLCVCVCMAAVWHVCMPADGLSMSVVARTRGAACRC
jgi:hypothetical protein